MASFVLLTAFLAADVARVSRSRNATIRATRIRAKHRDDPDAPWPVRKGGLWLTLYTNSLLLAFTILFVGSFVGHAVAGAHEYTAEQQSMASPALSTWQFVRLAEFWFQSFQNWQSEFLAVGAIVVLSIFLRQRGSAESKPVHLPHSSTGD